MDQASQYEGVKIIKASARKKDGKWKAFVELGYDSKGKRKQITRTPDRNSESAALKLAQKILADYLNDNFYSESKMEVGEFMNTWLERHKQNISYNTHDFYERLIRNHIVPNIGHIKLQKLKAINLEDLYDELRRTTDLSSTSIKRVHSTIYTAMEYAVKHEIIPKNPAAQATPPKEKKHKPTIVKKVVEDEKILGRLVKNLQETSVFVPCVIAIYTGLRRSEICGLRWENIDLDDGLIYVKEQLQRIKGKGLVSVSTTKTEGSYRGVSISEELYDILLAHRKFQEEQKELLGKHYHNADYVCTFNDGKPLSPDYVSKNFRKVADKTGMQGFRFHDFRHTFATMLINKGIDTGIVADLLGHSSVRVTRDIYTKILKPVQDKAVNKIKFELRSDEEIDN